MSYQLIFHPEAEKEYIHSFLWYENNLTGLGYRFEKRLGSVSANPQFYSIKKGSFVKLQSRIFRL